MPRHEQFLSYNIVNDDQTQRIRAIAVPIRSFAPDSDTLFNTYSLYQEVNQGSRTRWPHTTNSQATGNHQPEIESTGHRRRNRQSSIGESPSPRRRRVEEVPAEKQSKFIRKSKTFKDRWNKEFPDMPCVECATLLLPRHRKFRHFDEDHEYGITKVFGMPVQVYGGKVIVCESCYSHAKYPVDCGTPPLCIQRLPHRSRKFISPFQLDTNLGRTTGYNLHAIPFLYRTLKGAIITNPKNPRAIALYSGMLGAWLESHRCNQYDQGHDQDALRECRDWLLENNAVFQRNDVRAYLQVGNPLPLAHLIDENGDERRPPNRPDLVMNPFQYEQHTRDEHFRHNRLPVGAVQASPDQALLPTLYRSDPDVEVLAFPHLYPYGRGQWVEGTRTEQGRLQYTRHMDVKNKLNSVSSAFRDDWYWPSWAYQEIEATRIFQNTRRLIDNKTRQAVDNRLPQHQLLQQSAYGLSSIINEAITHTIPACIRTGESYFLEKERLTNSVLSTHGLPQLWITLTFNDDWPEFQEILQRTEDKLASNHPWEGIQYYYERIHNLKDKFWKTSSAKFGKLLELIERFEFQLRGAIHSHCLLWTEKSINQLIQEGFIRADIPDPEKEPKLHALVMKYQIHKCKSNICGGIGPYGKCSKGFPADPSDRTYHQPPNPRYTYKRTEQDIWVSPYNAELLLLWEGHLNVQFVTSQGLAAYITKYVTKSEPLSAVNVNGMTSMQKHVLARRIGSMEVMVLALGFDIFRSSSGSMYIPTALPEMRNFAVRPPMDIEYDPDNPYFPDALEKYFARPQSYEVLTYFQYFGQCEITKARRYNKNGPREGYQDQLGYWVYKRKKPVIIRSSYRRLCDGESFFFIHLLYQYHWRSDQEILGGFTTYRERLFTLNPNLYDRVLRGQEEMAQAGHLALGREYLEMVQRVAETAPINAQHMISEQLRQLNTMTVPGIADAAAVNLRGDQYNCYTAITQNISASRHQGRCFFVTGPGGTGKSYLLRAIQHWCDASQQPCVLLAPTGIAARNIDGNTIHSALSIYSERGSYHTGLFQFAEEKRRDLKKKTVLIIDEVSMVDAKLLDYVSATLAQLKENHRPFGNMHVIVFGDLMQLPPVNGQKVFKANTWKLFHPLFLEEPQRQTDLRFFNILNKIRFGIIDEEVRAVLTERWQKFDPRQGLWNTTYLSSLREEADALNQVVLSSLPPENPIYISEAEDFENGQKIDTSDSSRVFKRGTNFPSTVTCVAGAKVMFLTNSMLADKGISNGSIGIITEVLDDGKVKAAFPTKDGIQILELHKTSSYFQSYGAEYRRNQLPILNAFALTIHKVQGLSLPSMVMALNHNIFSDGQAYVGLSRARTLELLFLSHFDFDAIKADPEAIAEYDRLRAKAAELALQRH